MPKVLKKYEFASRSESSYDWTKLLDGKIYECVEGEDFECKPLTFMALARSRAARELKGIRISQNEEGNIVLQAYELTEEQKEALTEKRQAAKDRMKEKRAEKKAAAEKNGEAEEE